MGQGRRRPPGVDSCRTASRIHSGSDRPRRPRLHTSIAVKQDDGLEALAHSESIDPSELAYLESYLVSRGWLGTSKPPRSRECRVTVDGYRHLAELATESVESRQAFVAMWFDESTDEVYDGAIKPAIEEKKRATDRTAWTWSTSPGGSMTRSSRRSGGLGFWWPTSATEVTARAEACTTRPDSLTAWGLRSSVAATRAPSPILTRASTPHHVEGHGGPAGEVAGSGPGA